MAAELIVTSVRQTPSAPLFALPTEKEPAGSACFSFVTPWPMTVSSTPPFVAAMSSLASLGAAAAEESVMVSVALATSLPSKK